MGDRQQLVPVPPRRVVGKEAGQMNKAHKGMRLWRIVVLLALAFAAVGVPTAQAYDYWTCPSEFRDAVDQFKAEGGGADFGDDLHLGGAPQGTAVVCWDGNLRNANAARVILRGKLYHDNLPDLCCGGEPAGEELCVSTVIKFVDANGNVRATHTEPDLCGDPGLRSRELNVTVALPVTRMRLELYTKGYNAGDVPRVERTKVVTASFH
jgi:hypothetical protein